MNEDVVAVAAQAIADETGGQPGAFDRHIARLVVRALRNAGYRITRTHDGTTPKENHLQ